MSGNDKDRERGTAEGPHHEAHGTTHERILVDTEPHVVEETPGATDAPAAAAAGDGIAVPTEAQARPFERLRKLAERHPKKALLLATGAGIAVGAEFAVGAVVGTAAALLLTNRRGPEAREDLAQTARKVAAQVEDVGGRLWSGGKALAEDARSRVSARWGKPAEEPPASPPPQPDPPSS